MTAKPPRKFRLRHIRAAMSAAILVSSLACGAAALAFLAALRPPGPHARFHAAIAIVVTAVAAAAAAIIIGRTIRGRSLSVVPEVPSGGDPGLDASGEQKVLSRIIDSMEGGVMTISSEGTITSFNAVAQKTLRLDAETVVGRHCEDVFADSPANRALLDMIRAALTRSMTFSSVEVTAAASDGRTVPLGVTLSPLREEDGSQAGVVLTFKDLAELKRIREQVQRTDQLASLGRLSAGMAHEIRNPLGSLHGLVELIQEDLAPEDPKRRYTGTILRTISQLNTLVENLLDFSQPPVTHLDAHDLREIARECVQFCSFEQRRPVTVVEDYGDEPVGVTADREALSRALTNIIRNAFQATPEQGKIAVTVRERASGNTGERRLAVAAVSNTGSHIRPEDRSKLFTPFFTTKPDGTGLGLAIASQIVSAHSGQIEVESDTARGTTFRITLPAAAAEPARA